MRSVAETLEFLAFYLKEGEKLASARVELLNTPMPPALKDERDVDFKAQIETNSERILRVVKDLTSFPPFHDRHQEKLKEFHQDSPYEKSVFIMTKFPAPNSQAAIDEELRAVIKAVGDAVTACQHVPRIASEKDYYPSLWDNVELYLLGCRKGVAIVESKYRPELNPNVAMEWGWMRGLGRSVLYLVEKSFDQKRADWGGLIEYQFDWADPSKDVGEAVHKWLNCDLKH